MSIPLNCGDVFQLGKNSQCTYLKYKNLTPFPFFTSSPIYLQTLSQFILFNEFWVGKCKDSDPKRNPCIINRF